MKKIGEKEKQDLREAVEFQRLKIIEGIDYDSLSKIRDAYFSGLMLILPCKIGEKVYMVLPANVRCTKYRVATYTAVDIKWISYADWGIVVRNEDGWEIEVKFSGFGEIAFINEDDAILNARIKTNKHNIVAEG